MHIEIGIKKLVEFVLREGSIDSRFSAVDRAQLGSKIHRRLQKAGGGSYAAEQALSFDIDDGDISYTLTGRADGIIRANGRIKIDEIKSVSTPIEQVTEDYSRAHWAQACFYGYAVCLGEGCDSADIQLTYFNIDSEQIKRFCTTYTFAELEDEVRKVLALYRRWAVYSDEWQSRRDSSLKALRFPFASYRSGQRAVSAAVYRSERDGNRLFVTAPTGIGKTMSTLFPSLKAMGEGICDKIFYLTAKTVTSRAASDAISALYGKNEDLCLKYLSIRAKDKMCFLEKRACLPSVCPYAKDYFTKINDIVYSEITSRNIFTSEALLGIAEKNTVCPYELSLDISEWADVISCDYNYVFDPTVKLRRFFEGSKRGYTFLIDEAHNLCDRAREMYSSVLTKKMFSSVRKKTDKSEKKLIRAMNSVNRCFLALSRKVDCTDENYLVSDSFPEEIEAPLREFTKQCAELFDRMRSEPSDDDLVMLYFDSLWFLRVIEDYDSNYVTMIKKSDGDLQIKLFCASPSSRIDDCIGDGSCVAFSATLTPIGFYRDMLGGKGGELSVPSPFPDENFALFAADTVSTKYNDREASIGAICTLIHTFISARDGGYIVYFPSYAYMSLAYDTYCSHYGSDCTVLQSKEMSEEERNAFIEQFDGKVKLTAFCVLGGIYGEGIDLSGERLIGCCIVGVGLPQMNLQLDTLRRHYDMRGDDGFAFAYQYPGMNKVMQAAGRVIRTESDKGAVLLIDDRFTKPRYRANMPAHWRHLRRVRTPDELKSRLDRFWGADTGVKETTNTISGACSGTEDIK